METKRSKKERTKGATFSKKFLYLIPQVTQGYEKKEKESHGNKRRK